MLVRSFQLCLSFLVLVLFLQLGSWLNKFLSIPFPDALSGLLLLFLVLLFVRKVPGPLLRVSRLLLAYLPLFFIPATLSVLILKDKFAEHLVILGLALLVSTVLSMLIAGKVCQLVFTEEQDV